MKVPEEFRIRTRIPGVINKPFSQGGAFMYAFSKRSIAYIFASIDMGWEHVSVHIHNEEKKVDRTPTWSEMCKVKDLFWEPEEIVVQYHPPRSEYVNVHEHTLHMWHHPTITMPIPSKVEKALKQLKIKT